ncbi:hypothetical protein ACEPPN_015546 [Leptodophora sp. 'Broadleaf-Isolate-01']
MVEMITPATIIIRMLNMITLMKKKMETSFQTISLMCLGMAKATQLRAQYGLLKQLIKVDPAQDQIPYLTEDAITYIVIPKEDSDLEEIPDEETRREVSPDILDALAMPPLPRRASTASGLPVLEHIPKPIPHRREYIEISGLVFGLGIWCERYSISRSQYSQIGEDFSDL